MLSKTLLVLDLVEPVTDIHYHSGDSIDPVKQLPVLLLASPITEAARKHGRISTKSKPVYQTATKPAPNQSRNYHRYRKTVKKKTSPNPERTVATKTKTTKNPDWEVVNKSLTL